MERVLKVFVAEQRADVEDLNSQARLGGAHGAGDAFEGLREVAIVHQCLGLLDIAVDLGHHAELSSRKGHVEDRGGDLFLELLVGWLSSESL